MKLKLVSFELAKKLKELNWKPSCLDFYVNPGSKMFGIDEHGRSYVIQKASKKPYIIGREATLNSKNVILAPTLELAKQWFREVHDIELNIRRENILRNTYSFDISLPRNNTGHRICSVSLNYIDFNSYEGALEAGLLECCKLIK